MLSHGPNVFQISSCRWVHSKLTSPIYSIFEIFVQEFHHPAFNDPMLNFNTTCSPVTWTGALTEYHCLDKINPVTFRDVTPLSRLLLLLLHDDEVRITIQKALAPCPRQKIRNSQNQQGHVDMSTKYGLSSLDKQF